MKNLLVILFVIAGLYTTAQTTKPLSLEDVWVTYIFYPSSPDELKSMNDGEYYSILNGNVIEKIAYSTGKKKADIFDLNAVAAFDGKPAGIEGYEFSKDESKVLIWSGSEQIYRHSFAADYFVWDNALKKLIPVSTNGKQQEASFSPDGRKVAFVRNNNLFYVDLSTGQETQITKDGEFNKIINGIPDWVYEEEFSFARAYEWAPESNRIAFLKFDESRVKEYSMTMYGQLYPEPYTYKYPKAGEDNSIVTLHVYEISSGKTIKMDTGSETDMYIPRICWANTPGMLCFFRMNRLQNKLEILLANAASGEAKLLIERTDPAYIEITDDFEFTADGKNLILMSDQDGWNHLYMYDMNGKLVQQITKGEWDVTKYHGYDPATGNVYFTSAETSPMRRQLYVVKSDGTGKKQVTSKDGTHSIDFSSNFKYFIDTYTNHNTPDVITLYNQQGKEIRILEDNAKLVGMMKEYGFVGKEFFKFTTSDGLQLNGWMMKPADFDPAKKYPVFMTVYGGPGSQEVNDSWDYYNVWHQFLVQKGYIVACVDNRGTGGRGAQFRKCTYRDLGKYETADQIEAATYLGTLPFVDGKRIGIWGWSFGGYLSTLCLEKGAQVFCMAVAVAPVTNWRYYDSIYTERYNGLPKDNASGYDDNSPISHVKKIKGKYLLVHGTADDNVHFQNSMELVSKLTEANRQFEMQFYPNSNHGIYTGRNTRYHLFSRMTNFIFENL